MLTKTRQKDLAIQLRKTGKTYSEILRFVPVAKSTLSLWLRNVGLSRKQNHTLTIKKLEASRRGGKARKEKRISESLKIYKACEEEIGASSFREFWIAGVMLYWAEGAKEKEYRPGSSVDFTNSDPSMARLFICWLQTVCKVQKDRISLEIYIHKNYIDDVERVRQFWSKSLSLPISDFRKIYFKRHNPKTIRKNTGNMYNGNLRIRVKASSELVRKIHGWTLGVCKTKYCGIV